jgi:hypothetical protein
MSTVLESSEAAILERVIRPEAGDWPREAAQAILGLRFDRTDLEKMTMLLAKAKEGELTDGEESALEHYRHVGRLLELMKSRARRSLQASPAS